MSARAPRASRHRVRYAFGALGDADKNALRAELEELFTSHNQSKEASRTLVDAESL
jgi:hypothetical protein